MEVKLYKKTGTYFSEKDKKDKPFTNFYIKCNDQLIPVEVKYFPNPKLDNRDPGYSGRFQVLSAFAEVLPDKEDTQSESTDASAQTQPASNSEKTAF